MLLRRTKSAILLALLLLTTGLVFMASGPTPNTVDITSIDNLDGIQEDVVRDLYGSDGNLIDPNEEMQQVSKDNSGGFGGFYFTDGDRSTAYVYMTDPSDAAAATAAFRSIYTEGTASIRVVPVQGNYTMDQLVDWFHKTDQALYDAGIEATSGGIETFDNVFKLGLPSKDDLLQAEAILGQLGVPRNAVVFGFGGAELLDIG